MPEPLRIVVSGVVLGAPQQGGAAWAALHWALGASTLGHDVVFVEEINSAATDAKDVCRLAAVLRDAVVTFPAIAFRRGCDPAHPARQWAADCIRCADLVINLAGTLTLPELDDVPRSLFVDLDPGFTQWWATDGHDFGIARHTHHATVGLALGSQSCYVPTLGIAWLPTLPPVDLSVWPAIGPPKKKVLTTIAHWRSYGSVEAGGVRYGQKAHTLRTMAELPRRSTMPIEVALSIHPDEQRDIDMLREHEWTLVDPILAAATPSSYRQFIAESGGEFGLTKHGYIASRSGWFSDRSACYLATGRAVVVPDTGAGAILDHEGILRFDASDDGRVVENAATAIDDLAWAWESHARAAHAFADEHLDAGRVVGHLIEQVMA